MKKTDNVSRETYKKNQINDVSRETLDKKYMQIALKEAKKAYYKNEIPVGCVITYKNKIISKAHNKKEKNKNCLSHAEILCINKACKKRKNWRLDDCTLYVTMEPCMMCSGAIKEARIKKIVYGTENIKDCYLNHLNNIKMVQKINEKECKKLIKSFLKKIR